MTELTAAEILFPSQPTAPPAGQTAVSGATSFPKPAPAPAPAAPAPAQQAAPAAPAETAEERINRLFYGDKANAEAKPADGAQAEAKPAEAGALPDFLDAAHPDAGAVTPIVQELGLGREQVARLETLHQQMTEAAIDRQAATWAAESAAAFAKAPQDITDAQAAIKAFGTPELRAVLNKTGLGNHPELVKFACNVWRANPYKTLYTR